MSRYAPSSISYSFGPGPITFAVKWIIIVNVAVFLAQIFFVRPMTLDDWLETYTEHIAAHIAQLETRYTLWRAAEKV